MGAKRLQIGALWFRVDESAAWLADGCFSFLRLVADSIKSSKWSAIAYHEGTDRDLRWDGSYADLNRIFAEYLDPRSKIDGLRFLQVSGSEISCRIEGGAPVVASDRMFFHRFDVELKGGLASSADVVLGVVEAVVAAWDPVRLIVTDVALGRLEERGDIWRVRPGYIVWLGGLLGSLSEVDPTLPLSVSSLRGGTLIVPRGELTPRTLYDAEMKLFADNGIGSLPKDVLQSMEVPSRQTALTMDNIGAPFVSDPTGGDFPDPAESYREQISGWMLSPEGDVPLWVQPDQSSGVPVRFVGRTQRGDTEVFLHAIYGVDRFGDPSDQLAVRSAAKLLSIATWQLEVLPEGAVLEWHTDTASAATGLRNFLAIHGLTAIRVVHTPQV
uniref:hypothetical protein n=3 Tax=Bacteria TaxID=2 RepID=UPI002491761F